MPLMRLGTAWTVSSLNALRAAITPTVVERFLVFIYAALIRRQLRGALALLLRYAPLSKDAVSRLVGRLRDEFAAWAQRDLGALKIRYLFLDGWYPHVRIGK